KVLKTPGNPSRARRRKTGSGRGVEESELSRFLHETNGIRIMASGSRLLSFQTVIKCPNGKNAVQDTVNIKLSGTEHSILQCGSH
ncbi:hypothetical protein, partial [Deinococcus saxicola]|uniref:hypothetical protein n=1 Tax=Deinococcus saxicola TaxID=249406 RepID=UPI0039F0D387